jgi:2-haloalkanoic acid dehalogenase type II
MDWRKYRALTFDCYGTLIDWESGILAALAPWRARAGVAVADGELLAAFAAAESRIEAEQPRLLYPRVLAESLAALAGGLGASASSAQGAALGASVKDWPAFPDSAEALAYLKRRYKLGILSNIDDSSFAASNRKLGVAFDVVVTAEQVGSYKPNPAHFEEGFRRLAAQGVARDQVLHVAQSLFHDHVPAKRLGMTSVWINRRKGKEGWGATMPPEAVVAPDAEFPTLAALAEAHRAAVG